MPHDKRPFQISVGATFTAEPISPFLQFWAERLGWELEVRVAPYNQPLQTLVDPSGVFATNAPGWNVLLIRLEDLGPTGAARDENYNHLMDGVRTAAAYKAPLMLILCPSDAATAEVSAGLLGRAREALGESGGSAYSWHEIAERYPVVQCHDPEGDKLGAIPYTDECFVALATWIARQTHAQAMAPYKVIAVDCDNTLWDGICGEDGPEGVSLDPHRRFLHEFLLEQREAGKLLCMASKNNEDEVLETFAAHPEFPLRLEHFSGWRINWDPKAVGLASLAAELNVGLDSFLFIDDQEKECAEVEESAPEVTTLPLPHDVSEIDGFLRHVWAFDTHRITEEDRRRGDSYQQQRAFQAARTRVSLQHFLETLDLQVTIEPAAPHQMPRLAQLTQRTNQFNTTTIRRTEAELRALLEEGAECFAATVQDRFGDYGLTGILILQSTGEALRIETLLLSCRVLGRSVEHKLLAFAARHAKAMGLNRLEAPFRPTAKNTPAKLFLDSVGEPADGSLYVFDAAATTSLEWRPTSEAVAAAPAASAEEAPPVRRRVDYAAIARHLNTPRKILDAARAEARARMGTQDQTGWTETEKRLSVLWCELLQRPTVAREDNFFDIGGHSLVMVLMLMRIREEFGVELSPDEVYSGSLTLAALAAMIDQADAGGISPEEYQALLAEIENLSDEEVRALLDREESS